MRNTGASEARHARMPYALAGFLSLSVCILSIAYCRYFAEALDVLIAEGVHGYTGIVLPDTFLYLRIIDDANFLQSVRTSQVPNSLGPAFIWYVARGNWITVSLINSGLLFIGLVYLGRLASLLNLSSRQTRLMMFTFAFLPDTIYYSVGALKEIPTATCILGFTYHFMRRQRMAWLLFATGLVVLRYQMIFVLLLFVLLDRLWRRRTIAALWLLFGVSAMYPVVKWLPVFAPVSTAFYREERGAAPTLGGMVESVRDSVPVASSVAILVRIGQTIFEPFISVLRRGTFYQWGELSVINVSWLMSATCMIPFWLMFARNLVFAVRRGRRTPREVDLLYALCLFIIVPIGGFSFVHYRYLYPMSALVMLGALAKRNEDGHASGGGRSAIVTYGTSRSGSEGEVVGRSSARVYGDRRGSA